MNARFATLCSLSLACFLALTAGCYVPVAGVGLGASEPGRIHVVPGHVVVALGGSARVHVELFAPDGTSAIAQPLFSFRTTDETIAIVEPSGIVRGIAEGEAVIEVTDDRHGTAIVPVYVVLSAGEGPVALTCTPTVIAIALGNVARPTLTLTDAFGSTLEPSSAALQLDDPSIATVEPDGSIRGLAAGRTILRASGPSGELHGECTIIVAAAGSGGGAGVRCDPAFRCAHCEVSSYPRFFGAPGRSHPLRVDTQVFGFREDCSTYLETSYEVTPDSVSLGGEGVVGYFAGQVQALQPGVARYDVSWDGESCGTVETRVGLDLRGPWALSCDDGDSGTISLTASYWPDMPGRGGYRARGATFGSFSRNARGNGRVCSADGSLCDDNATGSASNIAPLGGPVGACSSGGCTGVSISHCGSGSGAAVVEGANRFRVGGCTYSRGTGDISMCSRPEVPGMCAEAGGWSGCSSQMLACIGDGLASCWYDVDGVRFTCATCPVTAGAACAQEASDYQYSRCFPEG